MYEESALPDMRRVEAMKTGYAEWTIYIMDYSLSCYIFPYKGRYLFCFVTDLWLQRYWRWLWSPAPHWADKTKTIWRNRTILIVSCICGETWNFEHCVIHALLNVSLKCIEQARLCIEWQHIPDLEENNNNNNKQQQQQQQQKKN